jgi:hypothetical protein
MSGCGCNGASPLNGLGEVTTQDVSQAFINAGLILNPGVNLNTPVGSVAVNNNQAMGWFVVGFLIYLVVKGSK